MKVLLPDHIGLDHLERIRRISSDIEIGLLKIISGENSFRKVARNILARMLPYPLFKTIYPFVKSQKRYRFLVNNQPLTQALENAEVFFASWVIDRKIFDMLIKYLPDLKWVQSGKTGVDHLNLRYMQDRNIILTNCKGVHSKRIAEFVIGCLFEVSKHLSKHVELTRRRKWAEMVSIELEGKVLGVLGAGDLGRAVAKKAKALGLKTIGYDIATRPMPEFDEVLESTQLEKVLKESDFIVSCLPLTSQTKHLIGKKELGVMKKTAIIIVVGRSQVFSEDDLVEALRNKKISGAVFDVFHPEMQLPNHPFYQLDNVILTHYSAHASATSKKEILDLFVNNLEKFVKKEELVNKVLIKNFLGS